MIESLLCSVDMSWYLQHGHMLIDPRILVNASRPCRTGHKEFKYVSILSGQPDKFPDDLARIFTETGVFIP